MLGEGHDENDLHKFRRLYVKGKTRYGKPALIGAFRIGAHTEYYSDNHKPNACYKERDGEVIQKLIIIKQGNYIRHNKANQGGSDLNGYASHTVGAGVCGSGKSKYAQRGHSEHSYDHNVVNPPEFFFQRYR